MDHQHTEKISVVEELINPHRHASLGRVYSQSQHGTISPTQGLGALVIKYQYK
jgi:hypothetical protein